MRFIGYFLLKKSWKPYLFNKVGFYVHVFEIINGLTARKL